VIELSCRILRLSALTLVPSLRLAPCLLSPRISGAVTEWPSETAIEQAVDDMRPEALDDARHVSGTCSSWVG
jgi:hypothetical protein